MNQTNKEHFVPIKDAAHILGILEIDIEKWIKEDKPILLKDYLGRSCVSEDYVKKCASKLDFKEAVLKALRAEAYLRSNDKTNNNNELFGTQRLSLLDDYNKYIQDLQNLHHNYLSFVDINYNEDGLTAAYILFYKVISLLYLVCDCIKIGYWFSGSLLREIDETLDVAHYFTIVENTDAGQNHLKKWFRLNKAPKHKLCREVISKRQSSINSDYSEADYRSLMNELYDKKSKWVHPTLNSIRELMIFEEYDGKLITKDYDYKSCGYERKLIEFTHFFRSSIWSSYQGFMFCFYDKMPLEDADKKIILSYNKLFQKLDSIDW